MKRVNWKGPYFDKNIFNWLLYKGNKKSNKPLMYKTKNSIILPYYQYKIIQIYTGKKKISLFITPLMIGHRIGEFLFTRSKYIYKKKKKKKNVTKK